MQVSKLSKAQVMQVSKVVAYVVVAALLSKLTSVLASNPGLFGPLTPVLTPVVAAVEKLFTAE